jgi:hypothetical protein
MPSYLLRVSGVMLGMMILSSCGKHEATTGKPNAANNPSSIYVTLSPRLSKLRDNFNANIGKVRLLYIVGATCPECLRGMDDLGHALADKQDDPRLLTYVVYVPALGAKAQDIDATVSLLPGEHVTRYWDPEGAAGKLFDGVLDTGGFAWDVWMIYGPNRQWNDAQPPKPDFWMDQLQGLPKDKFLDAGVFSAKVKTYLAERP